MVLRPCLQLFFECIENSALSQDVVAPFCKSKILVLCFHSMGEMPITSALSVISEAVKISSYGNADTRRRQL